MQINTFVRLGAGARNPTEVKPIELRPSIEHVSMEWFILSKHMLN